MMNDEKKELIDPFIPLEENEQPNTDSKFIPSVKTEDLPRNKDGLINPMVFEAPTKSFEEKIYIILYTLNDDSERDNDIYSKVFSICVGRTEVYLDIKNKLISGVPVDIHRSRILTETKQTETITGDIKYYMLPYEAAISVYSFCTAVKEYYNDEFDIEDYNDGDVESVGVSVESELASHPMYLTAEQQEYRKMLNEAIHRDKFIETVRSELKGDNV